MTTTLPVIVALVEGGALGFVCAITAIQRRKLIGYKRRDAEAVQAALVGCVRVDGVDLPLPTDERWALTERYFGPNGQPGKPERVLAIGQVVVRGAYIYVGDGDSLPPTERTLIYAADVWRAHRNRIARKAIET